MPITELLVALAFSVAINITHEPITNYAVLYSELNKIFRADDSNINMINSRAAADTPPDLHTRQPHSA